MNHVPTIMFLFFVGLHNDSLCTDVGATGRSPLRRLYHGKHSDFASLTPFLSAHMLISMKLNPEKIIDLYWFSGSGNTLFIAKTLAGFLGGKGFEVNLKPIEFTNSEKADLSRTTGLAIPVAEQGTYPFIWDFINNLPSPGNHCIIDADVFMVDTMMLYSGGIKGPVKKILKKKGFNLLGVKEIIMPNNLMKLKNQPDKDKLKMKKGRLICMIPTIYFRRKYEKKN